jgi:hypothetical protein
MPVSSGSDLFDRPSNADTGERAELDRYETAGWMVRSLLYWHSTIRCQHVVEPACGSGAIVRVLYAAGCTVITNDLDPRQPADTHMDATSVDYWTRLRREHPEVRWVVTNLPFNVAFEALVPAHAAGLKLALLLRKTFLEPTATRGPWLQEHPPDRQIGLPRHKFRGGGNDSVSCDWYVWDDETTQLQRRIVIDHGAKRR